jgi:hypothetical protein
MKTRRMQRKIFAVTATGRSAAAWITAALLAIVLAQPAIAQQVEASVGGGPDLARVAIEFEDGAEFLFEVLFDESIPITGLDAMLTLESELPSFSLVLIDFGFGLLIDGIHYDGHSNEGFGGGERYWHYWIRPDELAPWSFSDVGAADRLLSNGAWDGWVYGTALAPSPEPGIVGECGPGYFKNHVSVWDSVDDGLEGEAACCTGAIDASDGVTTECERILADLSEPGRSDAAHARADELNLCLAPVIACEDSPVAADPSTWRSF